MNQCPQCGSELWNNLQRKASGQMSAKAPDFKCKNEQCGWVKWPPKGTALTQKAGFTKDPQTQQQIVRMNALTNTITYSIEKAKLVKEPEKYLEGEKILRRADYFAEWVISGKIPQKTQQSAPQDAVEPPMTADEAYGKTFGGQDEN